VCDEEMHKTRAPHFSLGLAAKEPSSRFMGVQFENVCDECFIQRKALMFFFTLVSLYIQRKNAKLIKTIDFIQ
jgi:hypothetical protein